MSVIRKLADIVDSIKTSRFANITPIEEKDLPDLVRSLVDDYRIDFLCPHERTDSQRKTGWAWNVSSYGVAHGSLDDHFVIDGNLVPNGQCTGRPDTRKLVVTVTRKEPVALRKSLEIRGSGYEETKVYSPHDFDLMERMDDLRTLYCFPPICTNFIGVPRLTEGVGVNRVVMSRTFKDTFKKRTYLDLLLEFINPVIIGCVDDKANIFYLDKTINFRKEEKDYLVSIAGARYLVQTFFENGRGIKRIENVRYLGAQGVRKNSKGIIVPITP